MTYMQTAMCTVNFREQIMINCTDNTENVINSPELFTCVAVCLIYHNAS